ncbi:MDR family MFS transporter [Aspergillus novofumigatus IBT 16806]|uniref:MFS general substrate transporter n=1 Tax=Aspergillus novofumigatus (strain IBT 16806) TaxID=1392255 RepID=A0A2I1CPZ2_ASPN1|nr:MFS general substrate transporter [Aspergillus novofumigatus IBT 16806]PKX99683.1 MFS general substrate transporter [Aspergillus novofumigatus IBT 16806]
MSSDPSKTGGLAVESFPTTQPAIGSRPDSPVNCSVGTSTLARRSSVLLLIGGNCNVRFWHDSLACTFSACAGPAMSVFADKETSLGASLGNETPVLFASDMPRVVHAYRSLSSHPVLVWIQYGVKEGVELSTSRNSVLQSCFVLLTPIVSLACFSMTVPYDPLPTPVMAVTTRIMAESLSEERIPQAISKKHDESIVNPLNPLPQRQHRGWRFWAVFPGLCFAILLAALDTSVLATALPTIVDQLHSGSLYIWTINAYFLAVAAVQPIAGQASDIFGRRYPMIISVVLFALGSGLCGGASTTEMLIAARIVQGLGGGGIFVMVDIIAADLVALRERQKLMSIIMGTFALGTFIGPVLGGAIVTKTTWRWVFYINLPVAGIALVLVALFLRVKWNREGTLKDRLARVDFSGNMILSAAIVAILIALTRGGTTYTWSSWHILVPLLVGALGLVLFGLHQEYIAREPTMPRRVYSNTTSLVAYILTFLHGIIMSWLSFFLPVYFQVMLRASPMRSGVDILAIVIPLMPAGIAGGLMVAITGRLIAVGVGLLTLLTDKSSTATWVIFQIITGIGGGLSLTSTLPAVQAPLPEKDVAIATTSWAFVRSFGAIWGAAIPAAVFNSKFDRQLSHISDQATRALLARGGAYEHATKVFIETFDNNPTVQLWIPQVELRKELVTEFGLDEKYDEKKRREAIEQETGVELSNRSTHRGD